MTTTIDCAPLPRLVWDENEWQGKDHLAPWDGIDRCYQGGGPVAPRDRCTVRVVVRNTGHTPTPPTIEQREAYARLRESSSLVQSILDELFAGYAEERRFLIENDRADVAPPLQTSDGIRDLIALRAVYVHELTLDGLAYVGLEFSCAWEDEHGLGVVVLDGDVVDVGHADVAYASSPRDNRAARPTPNPEVEYAPRVEPIDVGETITQSMLHLRARCARLRDTLALLHVWVGGGVALLARMDAMCERCGAVLRSAGALPEHAVLLRSMAAPTGFPTSVSTAESIEDLPPAPTDELNVPELTILETALANRIDAHIWLTGMGSYNVDRRLDDLAFACKAIETLGQAETYAALIEEVDVVFEQGETWLAKFRDPQLRG